MSLTLDEVKNFLRLDTSDDDTLLEIYISTAEEYVKSACGRQVDLDNPKAHTIMLMLVGDYYENRSPYGQAKYSQNVSTMLMQLQLETPQDTDDEVKE